MVIGGNFVSSLRDPTCDVSGSVDAHVMQTEAVRRCFARISETIPVLFVPGDVDVGGIPTNASIGRSRLIIQCHYPMLQFSVLISVMLRIQPVITLCMEPISLGFGTGESEC